MHIHRTWHAHTLDLACTHTGPGMHTHWTWHAQHTGPGMYTYWTWHAHSPDLAYTHTHGTRHAHTLDLACINFFQIVKSLELSDGAVTVIAAHLKHTHIH